MSPQFPYRLLVVDDDACLRDIAKRMLEIQGYEVNLAADGFQGLTQLRSALPDIIISDLEMPNMNGFEFLSVVRKRFPQVAVIGISGAFSSVDVPSTVLADAFFQKGHYTPPQLFATIIALLEEMPVRARVARKVEPALWIPIQVKGQYIAVTCPFCLRTFPVATQALSGECTAICDFCESDVVIRFPVSPRNAAA